MSQPLSTRAIWGIVGIALIPIVVCLGFYFEFSVAKVPSQAATITQYDTSFITDMREPDKDKNAYYRSSQLHQVDSSTEESTQYQESELGKTDITKLGQ